MRPVHWVVGTSIFVLVCALVVAGYFVFIRPHSVAEPAAQNVVGTSGGTLRSPDGQTVITVPARGAVANTKVIFQPKPDAVANLNGSMKGVVALGTPVDVQVQHGALTKGTVTLAYSPSRIPRGLGPKQVGIAVFDTNLDAWVPLMDAHADPATHTVTGTAPHFSRFAAIVLDSAKAVVQVAGKVIKTTIGIDTTIQSWFDGVVQALGVDLINDLFAIAPPLTCNPASQTMTVTTKAALGGAFNACVENSENDGKVRLQNKYGFPIRLNLPTGITVSFSDLFSSNDGLVELLRNAMWMTAGQVVVAGASINDVSATPKMGPSVQMTGQLDMPAVAFDLGISVFLVLAPEEKEVDAALQQFAVAVEAATKDTAGGDSLALIATQQMVKVKAASTATSWLGEILDFNDCVRSAVTAVSSLPKVISDLSIAADLAHGCLGQVMGPLGLEGTLASLLGILKVIPETLEGTAIDAMNIASLGSVNASKVSVTISRFDAQQAFVPYVGTWIVHGGTLVISSNETGTDTESIGPCLDSLSDTGSLGDICNVIMGLKFTVSPTGITRTITKISYAPWGGGPLPAGFDPSGFGFAVGQTETILLEPGDVIKDTDQGGDVSHFCGPNAQAAENAGVCGA